MTNRKQVTQSPRPAPDIEAIIFLCELARPAHLGFGDGRPRKTTQQVDFEGTNDGSCRLHTRTKDRLRKSWIIYI